MWERAWFRWLLVFLFWTALALFFATQNALSYLYQQGTVYWWPTIKIALSDWYVWALLTPVAVWLARRFPFADGRRGRALLVHMVAGVVLTGVKIAIEGWVRNNVLGFPGRINPISKFHLSFITYWGIIGVTQGLAYYRMYREREVAAAHLQAQLAQAQLQALQMQLHPHFLFNTLHAISALMHRDVDAAEKMLARLSDLLRITLESGSTQEVRLKDEMDFLGKYLEIEQTRFQDRLTVKTSIAPETLDALVPNLILQPLVENAIRHGIASRAQPGTVEIRSVRDGDSLRIEICDDGPGLRPGNGREGLGLANTRARLAALYPEKHQFELVSALAGGVCARMTIPFQTPETA